MWLRTSFLAGVAVALATGGYSVGLSAKRAITDTQVVVGSSLGENHPLTLALRKSDLKESERARLVQVSNETAKLRQEAKVVAKVEGERLRNQAVKRGKDVKALEAKVLKLSLTETKDRNTVAVDQLRLAKKELIEAKGAQKASYVASKNIGVMLDKKVENQAAEWTFLALDEKNRADVVRWVGTSSAIEMNQDFALMRALDNRDALQLTPQQVTKLQLLQSDFIRFFAPLREQYETIAPPVLYLDLIFEVKGEAAPLTVTTKNKEDFVIDLAPIKIEGKALDVKAFDGKVQEVREVRDLKEVREVKGVKVSTSPVTFTGEVVLKPQITAKTQKMDTAYKLAKGELLTEVTTEGRLALVDDNPELKRLERELDQLKQKYTLKTYAVLTPTQQLKLKELLGSSDRK